MKPFLLYTTLALIVSAGAIAVAQPLEKPTPLEDLVITPVRTPPPVAFDGNSGSYTRKVEVPVWLWNDPSKSLAGIKEFQGRDSASPSFDSQGYSIGQGQGGRFTGGSIAEWKDVVRKGPTLLIVAGIVGLLVAVAVIFWLKQVTLGIAIGAVSGGLIFIGIMFESYPWIAPLVFVVAIAVLIWWLWSSKSLVTAKADLTTTVGKMGTALKTVVQGVQAAPSEAQAAVKAQIGTVAAATGNPIAVKQTITAVKAGADPTKL